MSPPETVTVETVTPFSTRARARGHTFAFDKLPASGGHDEAPMASEYLLAALASCQITTAHKIAAKRRRPIERIAISATAWFDDGGLIARIGLDIAVEADADDGELETVFRLTERTCTVSRALAVPIERTIRRGGVPPEGAPDSS